MNIKKKIIFLSLFVFVFSFGFANADCDWWGDEYYIGCPGDLSCCDDALGSVCYWGDYGNNYFGSTCVSSDISLAASETSCCEAEPYVNTYLSNAEGCNTLSDLSSLLEPCYDQNVGTYDNPYSNDYYYDSYTSFSSIYGGYGLGDSYCDESYYDSYTERTFHPNKMINWNLFAEERIYDLTGGWKGGREEIQHIPYDISYGDTGTVDCCGNGLDLSNNRNEWYMECIPYFNIYGTEQGYAGSNNAAVCEDGAGANPSYACCDNAYDCVYNYECYQSAFNSFDSELPYEDCSSGSLINFIGLSEDGYKVDTDDVSSDEEVCILGRWVDPDYSDYACEEINIPGRVWADPLDNCEGADRGWGYSESCTDYGILFPPGVAIDGYCCGDDDKENYICNKDNPSICACCDDPNDIVDLNGDCQVGFTSSCEGTPTSCGTYPNCIDCSLSEGCGTWSDIYYRNMRCLNGFCNIQEQIKCDDVGNWDRDAIPCNCDCHPEGKGKLDVYEGTGAGTCDDDIDNDCDGLIDLYDPGCQGGEPLPCNIISAYWTDVQGFKPTENIIVNNLQTVYLTVVTENCAGETLNFDHLEDGGFSSIPPEIEENMPKLVLVPSNGIIEIPWAARWFDVPEPDNMPDYTFDVTVVGEGITSSPRYVMSVRNMLEPGFVCEDVWGAQCCTDECDPNYDSYTTLDNTCDQNQVCCDECLGGPIYNYHIEVIPYQNTLNIGITFDYDAFAVYNDNSYSNITDHADTVFSISNPSVAEQQGTDQWKITTLAEGSTQISVEWQGVTGYANLDVVTDTVLFGHLMINPFEETINVGNTLDYIATRYDSALNPTVVTASTKFSSEQEGTIVSFPNNNERVKGESVGYAIIEGEHDYGGQTYFANNASLTVSASGNVVCDESNPDHECDHLETCYDADDETGICYDNDHCGGVNQLPTSESKCGDDCYCDCACTNDINVTCVSGECIDDGNGDQFGLYNLFCTRYYADGTIEEVPHYDLECVLEGEPAPFYGVFGILLTLIILTGYYFFKKKKF